MGVHTFWIEAVDHAGNSTIGRIEFSFVPFTMERNLLWVDDFYSIDQPIPDRSHPPENEHDSFWMDICSRAAGWTESDLYDCAEHNLESPDLELIGSYKNIIWTFSSHTNCCWQIVRFTPEDRVGTQHRPTLNYLPAFLEKGGHLWTLGRSERAGGLAAVLHPDDQLFPVSLDCRLPGEPCDVSPDYMHSMAYKDYCVTMLDKIVAVFRDDADMPYRMRDFHDVMTFAERDATDPVTAELTGLPERLGLWEEVTCEHCYFNPVNRPGGFTYIEIYDPQYRMDTKFLTSQECFHPIYRMRSRSTLSAVDNTAIALCLTRYGDVVPQVTAGIAVPARSFHFGFPLWFFDRTQVDAIVDVVFDEWQIRAAR
jgi:hypothetical protein